MLPNNIIIKMIFAMAVMVFLVFNLFGLVYSIDAMKMNGDGTMSDCFLMNQTSMCAMHFAEHINIWRLMFNSLLPAVGLVGSLLLVLKVVSGPRIYQNLFAPAYTFLTLWYRRYTKQTFSNIFNPLKEALSDGILHPKICL